MQLKECYDVFGGSFESVKQRIPNEQIIKKFLNKFLSEESFSNLKSMLEKEEYEEAFRAAHSLKGVSANLGFDTLYSSSAEMTELLREYASSPVDQEACIECFQRVSEHYEAIVTTIRQMEE